MIRINLKKYIFFSLVFFFFTLSLLFAAEQNAYQMAMEDLQKKGAVSCNPDEAYNFIMSRDAGQSARRNGVPLRVKPTEQIKNGAFVNGLDPELACRIAKFMKAYPGVKIIYGYRSEGDQQAICGAGKKHGCAAPGKSCHQRGLAADLSFSPNRGNKSYWSGKLKEFGLTYAYSSSAHVQCIEHPVASVFRKGGCLTPCVKADFKISGDGSAPNGQYLGQNQTADNYVSQQGTVPGPAYGGQGPSSNQYGYTPTNGESFEGIDINSELKDSQTDSWWDDLLGPTEDNSEYSEYTYSDRGGSSVVETAGQSQSHISFKPVLGYTNNKPGANEVNNITAQNSSTDSTSSSLGSNSNTKVSRGGLRQASFASFFSPNKETAIDRFFLTNSISNYSNSGLSAFIDDTARANSTLDQSIYSHKFKDTYETGGNYAEQVNSINYNMQNAVHEESGTSLWDTAKSYFSSGLDIASFVVFPTINIFAI